MSTIKVNNIESSTGGGVAAKLASVNGGFIGTKNLIINGSCIVAQRGTSSTQEGYKTIDRFTTVRSGNDNGPTMSQGNVASGTTPYSLGFRKSFKVTNGNQTSGAQASSTSMIVHRLEARDIATSGWNYTSSSSYITLSFWVKASVSQNYYFSVFTQDGTSYQYTMETGVLTADTWTKIIKTIPGNSNLQFDTDTVINSIARGFDIQWAMFRGTNSTGTRPLNAWAALDAATRVPNMTSTWYTTNDATFEITGVQLEVGSVATDFEHRSFAQELQLCKRYFQHAGASHWGVTEGSSNFRLQVQLEPEMRTAPTVTVRTGGVFNTRYLVTDVNITNQTKGTTTIKQRTIWTSVDTTGRTTNNFIFGRSGQGALGDYLACDAEL